MRRLIIVLLLFVSSCSIFKNLKPNETFGFNGKVLARVPLHWRVDITHPLKAELTLMKQDSTIIAKFLTDKDGDFNESIEINKNWNPIILKIKGLENFRIDTVTRRDVSGFHLSCTYTEASFQNITIIDNDPIVLEFECRSSERAGNKEEE